jgi:hypothetical protein
MLSETGLTAVATGGVLLYKVPVSLLVSFHSATVHQMAETEASASFAVLVTAASRYLRGKYPLAELTPGEAQRLNMLALPDSEVAPRRDSAWWQNLWLGSLGGLVGIGIVGNYQDLKILINGYGPEAARIFFPFPKRLAKRPKRPIQGDGLLLMTFTPEGLQRATRRAINPGRAFNNELLPPRVKNTIARQNSSGV